MNQNAIQAEKNRILNDMKSQKIRPNRQILLQLLNATNGLFDYGYIDKEKKGILNTALLEIWADVYGSSEIELITSDDEENE